VGGDKEFKFGKYVDHGNS